MVTKDQAAMLASLAAAVRPKGAKRWDEPGIVAALAKVNGLHLADVIHATIRAAEDHTLETPAAIGNTSSPVWTHYLASRELGKRAPAFQPLDPHERCTVCRHPEDVCRARDMRIPSQDRHDFAPDHRPTPPDPKPRVDLLRAALTEGADHVQ